MAPDEGDEDEGWLEWPDADDASADAVDDASVVSAATQDDDAVWADDSDQADDADPAGDSGADVPRIDVAQRVADAIDADARERARETEPDLGADDDLPSWMLRTRPASEEALESVIADAPPLEPGESAHDLLPAPTAVSAGRIDNVPAAIGALSMRIDSLIAATTTYRSVLSDRLGEYAELVTRLHRSHATDLDEFRKANERTVGEIRKTLAANEKSQREVAAAADALVSDVDSLTEFAKTSSADARELLEATDKLGRFVTEALDQFAERVLIELKGISESVTPAISSVRAEMALVRESLDQLNERSTIAPVREAIDELRADMSGLRRAVIEWPDLEIARSEIVAMRADLTNLLEAAGLGSGDEQGLLERTASDASGALAEVSQMRAELAPLVAAAEDDDQLAGFAADLSRLADLVAHLPTRAELEERLAEATAPADDDPLAAVHRQLDELAARVADVPGLADIRTDVVAALAEAAPADDQAAAVQAEVAELRATLERIETVVAADDGTSTTLESLAGEMAELRASLETSSGRPPAVDVTEIAAAVADQLASPPAVDVDAIAAAVADQVGSASAGVDASAIATAVADEVAALLDDRAPAVDVDALASRIADGLEAPAAAPAAGADAELTGLSAQVAQLTGAVEALSASAADGDVSDESLEKLAKQMQALRRRIKVRAQD